MPSLKSWIRGSAAPSPSPGTTPRESSPGTSATSSDVVIASSEKAAADRELSDLEDAMAAVSLVLNDDIDGAEERLCKRQDSSSFHLLGLGVTTFMRSILSFEKESMAEAASRLQDCEARAWADMKKAQKDTAGGWFGRPATATTAGAAPSETAPKSANYPPGSEFSLVHAEAQLMLAVVAVLNESLTEALRGFYRLRKAYTAVNHILVAEENLLKERRGQCLDIAKKSAASLEEMPGSFDASEFAGVGLQVASGPKTESIREKNCESLDQIFSPAASLRDAGSVQEHREAVLSTGMPEDLSSAREKANSGTGSISLKSPVDIFIHSGANMCFGILMLLISMVPPAFSRLLTIVGFQGDRERGIRMLWRSTEFENVNGGIAGLVLLAFYNALASNADILPLISDVEHLATSDEIVGYPQGRCKDLLARMRQLYPQSMLWRLEEARMLAANRRLVEAVTVLSESSDGKMRQITAMSKFELSIDAMCLMDWPLMSRSFILCSSLNNWSHALYYYNAGCAELELYRDAFHYAASMAGSGSQSEKKKAEKRATDHKRAAEAYFRKLPGLAGKKKFMARQIPFDVYVLRKLSKWEACARSLGLDLADAIGISPAQEMIYLWNGSRRMSPDLLEKALACLSWDRCTATKEAVENFKAAPDESALGSLCRVSLLRHLGRIKEAKDILTEEILSHDNSVFKGPLKDDYILAAANYEAAVFSWMEACDESCYPEDANKIDLFRQEKISECQHYLDKVAKWESFVLDVRIGMRVQTGLDTIRWIKTKKHWV